MEEDNYIFMIKLAPHPPIKVLILIISIISLDKKVCYIIKNKNKRKLLPYYSGNGSVNGVSPSDCRRLWFLSAKAVSSVVKNVVILIVKRFSTLIIQIFVRCLFLVLFFIFCVLLALFQSFTYC